MTIIGEEMKVTREMESAWVAYETAEKIPIEWNYPTATRMLKDAFMSGYHASRSPEAVTVMREALLDARAGFEGLQGIMVAISGVPSTMIKTQIERITAALSKVTVV